MHSRLKLALAVLTSPAAAFEEIAQRRLLGMAVIISALAGTIGAAGLLIHHKSSAQIQLLAIGRENPLTFVGLLFLYALILKRIIKFVGAECDYAQLVTVMGWSQVSLLVAQTVKLFLGGRIDATGLSSTAAFLVWIPILANVYYVVLIGHGTQAICSATGSPSGKLPALRGAMCYLIVQIAAMLAFSITFAQIRLSTFAGGLPGVYGAARAVTAADQSPWFVAGIIGLVVGIVRLGDELGRSPEFKRLAAIAGLIGLLPCAYYIMHIADTDYYGRLIRVQRLYDLGKYSQAAKSIQSLMGLFDNDPGLLLDMADTSFLAGDFDRAHDGYSKFSLAINKAGLAKDKLGPPTARALSGAGAVADAQGRHSEALAHFDKAISHWKEFRDPWVRKAVTLDRMGRYSDAIEAGNHAVKKLDSEAAVVWVALAQAFINTGDKTQAKAAIAMVTGIDDELAKRIGTKAEDWKNAVSKLTREDLKYPLEKNPAPSPGAGKAKLSTKKTGKQQDAKSK